MQWKEFSMRRSKCPVCSSKNFQEILDLGNHPLADSFFVQSSPLDVYTAQPLVLMKCNGCFHFFLSTVTDPTLRYQSVPYSYTTGNSKIAVAHFQDFAQRVKRYGISNKDVILDIGGNDGTLLSNFIALGCSNVLNIEPSKNISKISEHAGVKTINSFFTKELVGIESKSVGTILSANVVNHIDDCGSMMETVDHFLQEGGLFVFQVPYIVPLLQEAYFETIYHEHVHYFSVHSVSKLLAEHGFYIDHVERSDYMCGSIRFYCKKEQISQNQTVKNLLDSEISVGLTQTSLQTDFVEKCAKIRAGIRFNIATVINEGGRVIGFSAATKANTLLNFCGVTKLDIPIVYDTSRHKIGKLMPGSDIPIIDELGLQKRAGDVAIILADNMRSLIKPKLEKLGYKVIDLRNANAD